MNALSPEIKTNNDLMHNSDEDQDQQPSQKKEEPQPRRSARQKLKEKVDYKQLHAGKKESLTDPQSEKSVVKRHIRSTEHEVGDMTYSVIEYEPDWEKRLFKEAIAIRTLKPSLNEDPGKRHIPYMIIYLNLMPIKKHIRSIPVRTHNIF